MGQKVFLQADIEDVRKEIGRQSELYAEVANSNIRKLKGLNIILFIVMICNIILTFALFYINNFDLTRMRSSMIVSLLATICVILCSIIFNVTSTNEEIRCSCIIEENRLYWDKVNMHKDSIFVPYYLQLTPIWKLIDAIWNDRVESYTISDDSVTFDLNWCGLKSQLTIPASKSVPNGKYVLITKECDIEITNEELITTIIVKL